jgi:hypothetical protein
MLFGPVPPSSGTLPEKVVLFFLLAGCGFLISSISKQSNGKVMRIIIFLVGALIISGLVFASHFLGLKEAG